MSQENLFKKSDKSAAQTNIYVLIDPHISKNLQSEKENQFWLNSCAQKAITMWHVSQVDIHETICSYLT